MPTAALGRHQRVDLADCTFGPVRPTNAVSVELQSGSSERDAVDPAKNVRPALRPPEAVPIHGAATLERRSNGICSPPLSRNGSGRQPGCSRMDGNVSFPPRRANRTERRAMRVGLAPALWGNAGGHAPTVAAPDPAFAPGEPLAILDQTFRRQGERRIQLIHERELALTNGAPEGIAVCAADEVELGSRRRQRLPVDGAGHRPGI